MPARSLDQIFRPDPVTACSLDGGDLVGAGVVIPSLDSPHRHSADGWHALSPEFRTALVCLSQIVGQRHVGCVTRALASLQP